MVDLDYFFLISLYRLLGFRVPRNTKDMAAIIAAKKRAITAEIHIVSRLKFNKPETTPHAKPNPTRAQHTSRNLIKTIFIFTPLIRDL